MQSITNVSRRCMSCRRTVTIRLQNYKMLATTSSAKVFHVGFVDFFWLHGAVNEILSCDYYRFGLENVFLLYEYT